MRFLQTSVLFNRSDKRLFKYESISAEYRIKLYNKVRQLTMIKKGSSLEVVEINSAIPSLENTLEKFYANKLRNKG